jgi:apolipoprotein N-acyltransferase
MENTVKATKIEARWPYLWLLLGSVFLYFGVGRWAIPIAVWIGPVFMLRFIRTQKPLRGFIITLIVFFIIMAVTISGVMRGRVSLLITVIVGIITGAIYIIPLIIDRLIAPRIHGLLSTLFYPMAGVMLLYIGELAMGGNFLVSASYAQYVNMPLIQTASVAGVWGIQFLVSWLASIVNFAWEQGFDWHKVRKVVFIYAGVMSAILLYGGARLVLFQPDAKTVRIAAITTPDIEGLYADLWRKKLPPLENTISTFDKLTMQAIHSGAKIVFWQEDALIVSRNDEPDFIAHGGEIAKNENIYLLMAMNVVDPAFNDRMRNKVVLVKPDGGIGFEYIKHYPAPGSEASLWAAGSGKIPVLATPYGRIASVICHDADFPLFINQLRSDIDILLVPVWDWKEITPLHAYANAFRSIEHGFSLVRSAGEGLSIAVDPYGRTLAEQNYFNAHNHIMLANVPVKGVATVYSLTGDLVAWLCIAGFAMIVVWALSRR